MRELVADNAVDAAEVGRLRVIEELAERRAEAEAVAARGGRPVPSQFAGQATEPTALAQGSRKVIRDRVFEASARTLQRLVGNATASLEKSSGDGLGIKDAAVRLRKEFKSMREFELRRIARTEINRAQQEAAMITEEELGVEFHQWITGSDERVRSSHRAQHNEIARVGAQFSNGLRRPLESGAPLGEVVNCRCRIAPWIMPAGFRAPTGKSLSEMPEFVAKSFFPGEIVPLGGFAETELAKERQRLMEIEADEFPPQPGEMGFVPSRRRRKTPRVGANEPGALIERARGTVVGGSLSPADRRAELKRINNLTQSELFDEFKLNIDEIIALEGSGRFGTPSFARTGDLVFEPLPRRGTFTETELFNRVQGEPPINGVLVEDITQLNAGLSGDIVELLLMEDGTQYVRKSYNDLSVRERERIVAQFGEAMGVPVAKTVLSDVDDELVFEFIEGTAAGPLSWNLPDEVTELPGGRELGLFDFLISNTDRHGLNARITPEGTLVGIDHGSQGIFSDDWLFGLTGFLHAGDSPFIRRWVPMEVGDSGQLLGVLANSFTRAELQAAVDAAASTSMNEAQFAQVLNRVDMLLTANSESPTA